jgi:hypothetical protein
MSSKKIVSSNLYGKATQAKGNNMSKPMIHMFQRDYELICNYVLENPNIETGGDLFGLWKYSQGPVIQFVIGPGRANN